MQNPPSGHPPQGSQPPRPSTLPPPAARPVATAPSPNYESPRGAPPPGVPPQWSQEPTQYGASGYGSQPPPSYGPSVGGGSLRKSRRSLRFLASTCVFTGWLTLVLSLLGGGISLLMGIGGLATSAAVPNTANYFPAPGGGMSGGGDGTEMPTLPGMGGGGGLGGAAGMGVLMPQLGKVIAAMTIGGALFTLVSGVVTFLLFLGLGQACYALLDMEEQQHAISDTLGIILARLGNR